MSYHLANSLAGLGTDARHDAFLRHKVFVTARQRIGHRFVGPYHVSGYGGAGGLGDDAKKQALELSKALAMNALTPREVALVKSTWDKYNSDLAALTTGKKKITLEKALGILGPSPSIEKIVGHALVAGAAGGVPGVAPGAPPPPPSGGGDTSDGTPWGLIAGGVAILGVGYVLMNRGG